MSELAVRLARLGDAPRIASLSRTLIEDGPAVELDAPPRRRHMRSREHLTVIAVDGGELAGFVLAQFGNRAVHLALLGVAPRISDTDSGRQLMAWVEETASVAGLFLMQLEVRAGNQQALRFYARSAIGRPAARPGTTVAWKMRSGSNGIWRSRARSCDNRCRRRNRSR